jgi:hypoxanthine phosphoribosyltransferase
VVGVDFLGQFRLLRNLIEIGAMQQVSRLLADRLDQPRMAMAERAHGDAGAEIEVAFPGFIPQPAAGTAHRHKRKTPVGGKNMLADLLRRVPRVLEIECLNVASYHGGLESSGMVDFLDRHFPEVQGRHVLLLDDILDTGRTLDAVTRRLIEEGAVAVHTAVLLAKDKPRAADVQADYVGFEIGDEFVVGYGLDYQGKYRNLPYVGVLKLSAAV